MFSHMTTSIMQPIFIHIIITTLFILILPTYQHNEFQKCNDTFSCGVIHNITYPFYGGTRPDFCGRQGFELSCPDNYHEHPEISIHNNLSFRILDIDSDQYTMKIARSDFWGSQCPSGNLVNTMLDNRLFNLTIDKEMLYVFYNCRGIPPQSEKHAFSCSEDEHEVIFHVDRNHLHNLSLKCKNRVDIPVMEDSQEMTLRRAIQNGFHVEYKGYQGECDECKKSYGTCGSVRGTTKFACYCRDGPHPRGCNDHHGINWTAKIIIAVCAAIVGIGLAGVLFFFLFRRYRRKFDPSLISRGLSFDLSKADAEQEIYMGLYVFCYDELEKATNNFDDSKQLGDGGFGTVYYGELKDGRAVAVKRLFDNNYKRVEQFMNEIDILARLRHKNLVTLYGCTSRRSRELLLVYEYVPNGTVADHLHRDKAKPGAVPWSTRLNIAIETASALTFLHASDIIHRDVKTTNILLDANFCVKVGDFGLSRLFPTHVTHISTAPQGTPGYVDPEYHQCYQLTDKSDVYSFGVVLIELISSKPAVDVTRHRHEVNLSNMAINKIRNNSIHELVDPNLGYESDQEVKRMINCVAELAFRCLQYGNDMRPSMAEVSDILNAIQNEKHGIKKSEKPGIAADDAVLPKRDPVPLSPNSVTDRWTSTSTTPNVSTSKSS